MHSTHRQRLILILSWMPVWLIGSVGLISSSGCRGCVRDDSEKLSPEEREKKAREQKEALELKPLRTLPADSDIVITTAKAGHWVETVRQVKSNREDLQVVASGDVMRGTDKVLNIPHTSITTEFTRPTVLPKGQTKTIDLQYFIPTTSVSVDPNNPVSTVLRLRSSLLSRSMLTPIVQEPFSAAELGFGEFLLTVVSPKPQEYGFLSATDLVLWRGTDLMMEERLRCFRVVLCGSKEGKIELPTSLMTMTMMSVMIWDDLAPDDLSEDQKTAILDWLHWGGQIVISGPGSWSRLQNSFLSPYLPVRTAEAIELGTEELAALNHWVVRDVTGQPEDPLQIVGNKMPGLKMNLSEQGSWLPHAEELVAERAVGRGRIVVTGFPLREQRIYRWKYFSSLLSTGILRRPARTVDSSGGDKSYVQNWAPPFRGDEKNPVFNTNLRIASRDIRLNTQASAGAEEFGRLSEKELQTRMTPPDLMNGFAEERPTTFTRYGPDSIEAVQWAQNGAAWSDTSGFAFSAISTLRQAAGIVLPSRMTIIALIGSYLLLLVPLNWLFFRLIGRLELAWVAAPIMALLGVLIVTRVARLDIGFARRTTEIGLLELQGEYPRAHLTNYAALYTSLSTNYAMELPERGSVVLPLGNVTQGARRSGTGNKLMQAKYGTSAGMRLEPVTVYSNSTEMLHAEQMVKLEGGLLYGIPDTSTPEATNTAAIKNATGLELKSCCLIRKNESGQIQFAWIGDMPDANSRTAKFVDADLSAPWEHWNRNIVTCHPDQRQNAEDELAATTADGSKAKANELLMGDLLNELLSSMPLVRGQVRLFGYTDARPGKLQSEPGDGRLDTRSIVMAHLRPAAWTQITRDMQVLGRVLNVTEPPETKDVTDEPAP